MFRKDLESLFTGALFDFCGYLSGEKAPNFEVGASHDPLPLLQSLQRWCRAREINLEDPEPQVLDWEKRMKKIVYIIVDSED